MCISLILGHIVALLVALVVAQRCAIVEPQTRPYIFDSKRDTMAWLVRCAHPAFRRWPMLTSIFSSRFLSFLILNPSLSHSAN